MITDANTVQEFMLNTFVGITGGNFLLLGILVFLIIGFALIYGKARASTVVMIGASFVFVFSLLDSQFAFLFWLALIASIFVLINGLRKWITSP